MKSTYPDETTKLWLTVSRQPALGTWFAVWLLTRPETAPAQPRPAAKPQRACAA